ncbi:uncharacterized protein LOC107759515 [Nicotiana tabacum]|uniref:Uncharacterized protein LOC107759515 n=1 Tax=Nicotiana tabacum TaxID=4097 RepID=A0A1S3WZ25_TOBAC|nr:PREDICTED: uncharacterized protein LOC107759515 [Nicotiana tabacum]
MEIAIIDWKTIDSRFVKDDLLEHFNAPQWVDFLVPDAPVDDDAWFCKPDCNHPKTVEDFYKANTPSSSSKLQRSASVSDMPLGERNRRDATLKKRGQIQPSVSSNKDMKYDKIVEDSENQNPNFATPPRFRTKLMKQTFKSSAEKKPVDDNISLQKEQQIPKLRSTLSARNLFAGGDLLNKVTDFCNELKKLVTIRTKEKENGANENLETSPLMGNKQKAKDCIVDDEQRERKPLFEMTKETNETVSKGNIKEKQRRKLLRNDNAENTPILVDVKNIKRKDEEILSQIRTNPPTPQCFSASRGTTKATPSKAKYRPLETRGILQELEQSSNEEKRKEDQGKMMSNNQQGQRGGAIVAEKEAAARALDVFWFLKPCTLSS